MHFISIKWNNNNLSLRCGAPRRWRLMIGKILGNFYNGKFEDPVFKIWRSEDNIVSFFTSDIGCLKLKIHSLLVGAKSPMCLGHFWNFLDGIEIQKEVCCLFDPIEEQILNSISGVRSKIILRWWLWRAKTLNEILIFHNVSQNYVTQKRALTLE